MPKLRELWAAENRLTEIGDIGGLPNLKILHLRANNFKKIPEVLPELPKIHHFNLRDNQVAKIKELLKLQQWSTLRSVNVTGNPMEDEAADGIKKEILILLPD